MFITFEGIDGSGKSTQIKLLKDYLVSRNYDVLTIREPGGTPLSEQIRNLLLSDKNIITPVTELLLFEAARSHLVDSVIKPALNAGKVVLSDRFYDSTTAYQGYGRGLDIESIKLCNSIATSGLNPDITIFLKVSIDTSNYRSVFKDMDRIESSGDDFFNAVSKGFQSIASDEPDRVFIVNSEQKINQTHQNILEILRRKFPNGNF